MQEPSNHTPFLASHTAPSTSAFFKKQPPTVESLENSIRQKEIELEAVTQELAQKIASISASTIRNAFQDNLQHNLNDLEQLKSMIRDIQFENAKRCLGVCLFITSAGTFLASSVAFILELFSGKVSGKYVAPAAEYSFYASASLGLLSATIAHFNQMLELAKLAGTTSSAIHVYQQLTTLQTQHSTQIAKLETALEHGTPLKDANNINLNRH